MSDRFEYLAEDDIISLDAAALQHIIGHTTFRSIEFLEALASYISDDPRINEGWAYEGIDCRILSAGKYWRTGKVRLSLEFIPDEPYPLNELPPRLSASVDEEY